MHRLLVFTANAYENMFEYVMMMDGFMIQKFLKGNCQVFNFGLC